MTASIAIVVVAVIALAVYALVRRPKRPVVVPPSDGDFADLDEAERCDYLFALAALDDPANVSLLRDALDDPSEVVAIAAARSLVASGRSAEVKALLAQRGDERAQDIAAALELLA